MSSFTQEDPPILFSPLKRNPSIHNLSDMSSIWKFEPKPTPQQISKPFYSRLIDALLENADDGENISQTLYSQLMSALLENADDGESYENAVKRGNIILDMDGTLGDNIPGHLVENPYRHTRTVPIPRPGLKKFLRFVFAHYERVSIWTAALPFWYNQFKQEVLLPNMPPGAEFHFERTRLPGKIHTVLKPLSEIYAMYPEYNEANTTIVDDNVETFKENRENAVQIAPFHYDMFGETPEKRKKNAAIDKGLFIIIEVLRKNQ
jgi:hypothetical protein